MRRLVLSVLLLAAGLGTVAAQETTGTITGVVTDQAGAVVPGVNAPRLEGGMTVMPFGPFIFVGTAFCVLLERVYGHPFTF